MLIRHGTRRFEEALESIFSTNELSLSRRAGTASLRDLAYSSCEKPLTRAFGRGGTSREIRDVPRGWGASGRPLFSSRLGDTERRTRGAISRLKMFALVTIQTRSEDAQLVAEKKPWSGKKDGTDRARLEPRARATTSFDTPSSGGASVPSRIRPESTVRETPHPVTRALSSSKPRSLSVARIPTFSRLRGVLVDRAQARACARHETRRTACTRSTSRLVAMRAPAGARAPHQATGAPASFLRRPFLTGPHAACLGCRAIFSYESTSVIFSLCMTLPGAGASFCG
jgi:hypothetical protein